MQEFDRDTQFLDANDTFKPLTDRFNMPVNAEGQKLVYLNGNSLGPKPKGVDEAVQAHCEVWGRLGVRGHFDGADPWISYHQRVTLQLARLVGAQPDEVIAMGSLTENLHLAFISFYQPTPTRYKIIRFAGFPSDTYALASQVRQRLDTLRAFMPEAPFTEEEAIVEIQPDSSGYISIEAIEQVLAAHGDKTAVLWLEAVHYLTGQYFDIQAITQLAHRYGCMVGFDLAHAVGNLPLQLHDWGVDFAVWCSYKYLSAGPGAIAGLYIREPYVRDPQRLRLAGWWGNKAETRFAMSPVFDPALTAEGWQLSNAPIISLRALHAALCVFDSVEFAALREKNKRLVAYLEYLLQKELGAAVQIITPTNPEERGCQLSLRLKALPAVDNHLEHVFLEHGVVCDVRGDLVRVAPMGLYSTYKDIFCFVQQLKKILI
ncbi:MAG: kynureninase [Legionellaceae bacterium]|nr:kynureninase [Legionellaceae bacterium]